MSLLHDNPALARPDWLPEGIWPDLDELRERHLDHLQRRVDAAAEASTVRAQFDAEDEARVQAYENGEEPPGITSPLERQGALADVTAKCEGADRALARFVENAVERIQELEPQWLEDLSARNAKAEHLREDAARLYAEAERTVAEVGRTLKWVERTTENRFGMHVSHEALGVVVPEEDERSGAAVGVPVES